MTADWRRVSAGLVIPTEGYCDQPYLVRTDDGAWVCCVTTGPGQEGAAGQHVVTLRSTDRGGSWSAPVAVEPGDGREHSYAVLLKAPSGRLFIFYNHNTDDVRAVRRADGGPPFARVDSLGHFVFKYSDDHGRSWSPRRYEVPFRLFRCDRENVYGGALCFFWNVGKPFVHAGQAYVPLIKVGRMGRGFFAQSEGALLVSDNLLTAEDPAQIRWETLPEGDMGLRTPPGGGPIAEEQSYCVLSDGSFYVVYRSIDGYPVESYSRDGGRTWATPRYKCFADGRRMKHPRAANFVWRCRNGRYLYWFHHHGGRCLGERADVVEIAYAGRNPGWLCAGIEIDTPAGREIAWSEPELVLYDEDPAVRISYPDLLEEAGAYYLTETQKTVARVHEIPAALPEAMWAMLAASLGQQPWQDVPAGEPPLLALPARGEALPAVAPLPRFADTGAGLALSCRLTLPDLAPGRVLLDTRDAAGRGLCLHTLADGALEIVLGDGQTTDRWASDPVLQAGRPHHVVVNLDAGPRLVSFIIDGRYCDGGDICPSGWGRFSPALRDVTGGDLRLAPCLAQVSLYGRALFTWEAAKFRWLGD